MLRQANVHIGHSVTAGSTGIVKGEKKWYSPIALAAGVTLLVAALPVSTNELAYSTDRENSMRAYDAEIAPTSTGAYTYSIPLHVPSFHGIEPRLTLTYSSDNRGSFIGPGWSLAGLRTIVRKNKGNGTPRYDSNDIYFLDGIELIECADLAAATASPSCPAGITYSNSIGYSTVNERNWHIRRDTIAGDWTITVPNGTVMRFAAIDINSDGTTWRWGLSQIQDTLGNVVNIGWESKMTHWCDYPGFDACDEAYPAWIQYGSADSTIRNIEFYYYGINERYTKRQFGNGHHIVTIHGRLAAIVVRDERGATVRAYDLQYGQSHPYDSEDAPNSVHLRLESVQEFGRGARIISWGANSWVLDATGTVSLPPTRFSYSYTPGGWSFSRTAWPHLVHFGWLSQGQGHGFFGGSVKLASLVDLNGDRLPDSVFAMGDTHWLVKFNLGPEQQRFSHHNAIINELLGLGDQSDPGVYSDPNVPDVDHSAFGWPRRNGSILGVVGNGPGIKKVFFNDNRLYDNDSTNDFFEFTDDFLADMNGDGRPDQVYVRKRSPQATPVPAPENDWMWYVALNSGTGFELHSEALEWPSMRGLVPPLNGENALIDDVNQSTSWSSKARIVDMNGDGLVDYVKSSRRGASGTSNFTVWDFEVALNEGGAMGPLTSWSGNIENKPLARKRTYDTGPYEVTRWSIALPIAVSLEFDTAEYDYSRAQLIDMNGDGLPDHVFARWKDTWWFGGPIIGEVSHLEVRLNTGSGFSPTTRIWRLHGNGDISPAMSESFYSADRSDYALRADMQDMNNDGLLDSVVAVPVTDGDKYDIYVGINNGIDRLTYVLWAQQRDFPVGAGEATTVSVHGLYDIDGDGLLDNVFSQWNSQWYSVSDYSAHVAVATKGSDLVEINGVFTQIRQPSKPDLLVKIIDPKGATTRIDYTPSTAHADTFMPLTYTVSQVSVKYGQKISTTRFEYEGGRYNSKDRRSLGFAKIKAIHPATTTSIGIPNQQEAPETVNTYVQNCGRGALPLKTIRYPGSEGTLAGAIETKYGYGDGSGSNIANSTDCETFDEPKPYRTLRTERITTEYGDDPVTDFRKRKESFSYDEFGNITQATDWGEWSADVATGDEVTTVIRYATNVDDYIVNIPRSVKTMASATAAGDLLASERFCYDGDTSCTARPTKGLLTRHGRCVDLNCGTEVLKPEYEVTDTSYDEWGNVVAVTNPRGFRTTFDYDTTFHKFLVQTTNPIGHTVSRPLANWDVGCEAPLEKIDENGLTTGYSYDALCRLISTDYPGGDFELRSYLDTGNPYSQRIRVEKPHPDGSIFWHETFFDGLGQVYLKKSRGPGAAGSYKEVINQGIDHNLRGGVKKSDTPYYDAPAGAGYPNVYSVRTDYDGLGRAIAELHPRFGMTTHRYNAPGEVTTIDAKGHTFKAILDVFGRVIERQSIVGGRVVNRTQYRYDPLNNVTQITDDADNTWIYKYDALERRTFVDDPDSGELTIRYYPGGLIERTTDNKGQQVEYNYDALGRMKTKTVKNGVGNIVEKYGWDYDEPRARAFNIGYQTSAYDMRAQESSCAHSEREVGAALSSGCSRCAAVVSQCFKDDGGNCIGELPLGTARTYCGNAADSRGWDEFCVELADRLCYGQVPALRTRTDYDRQGNVIRHLEAVANQTYTTTYGYYDAGELKYIVHPELDLSLGSEELPLIYDGAGRLSSIPSVVTNMEYTADGKPATQVNENGTIIQWKYFQTMLVGIKTNQGATLLQDLVYGYDNEGQLTSSSGPNNKESWVYEYDYDHRLTLAADKGPPPLDDKIYVYDSIGNLTSDGTYSGPGLPRPHAVISRGPYEYEYDDNGNMTLGHQLEPGTEVHKFGWDAQNQLIHGEQGKDHFYYTYDATSGARTRKGKFKPTGNPVMTVYLASGFEIEGSADEWDTSMWSARTRVRLGDRLVARRESNRLGDVSTTWISPNHQGSTHLETDNIGAVLARQTYTAYGNELTTEDGSGSRTYALSTGFIGERIDNSFITYLNGRYYAPELGRFLSPDPLQTTTPAGLNRYAYAYNNPIRYVDPTGLQPSYAGGPLTNVDELIREGLEETTGDEWSGGGYGRPMVNMGPRESHSGGVTSNEPPANPNIKPLPDAGKGWKIDARVIGSSASTQYHIQTSEPDIRSWGEGVDVSELDAFKWYPPKGMDDDTAFTVRSQMKNFVAYFHQSNMIENDGGAASGQGARIGQILEYVWGLRPEGVQRRAESADRAALYIHLLRQGQIFPHGEGGVPRSGGRGPATWIEYKELYGMSP